MGPTDTRTNRAASRLATAAASTDAQRLDFIERVARESRTGISFGWMPSVEGEPSGLRLMRYHDIEQPCKSVRAAIDAAMRADAGDRTEPTTTAAEA